MPQFPGFRDLGQIAARMASAIGYRAPSDAISSVSGHAWPNPSQPVAPIAPKGSGPIGFPFWEGQNLSYTPRPDAEFTAADLKSLATYPLAAISINNVEDQICQMKWSIQLRERRGEPKQARDKRSKGDPNIVTLSRFFERPDGENFWQEWIRPFIDAMLVYDAGSILVLRGKKSGKIGALRVIPGDSIARYIDDSGFTPQAPDPAYSQLYLGIPRVDLTRDQLVYKPRNIQPRNTISSFLYGNSQTAQLAQWIQIGQARLAFVYAYYRTGSIPDMIHVAPASVTSEKVRETQDGWNSEFAGQLDKRRGYSILQGFTEDGKDQILFPKASMLTDNLDELLIRIISFGYGSSPQRLLRPMNRGSAMTGQEAAEEEGIKPLAVWMKAVMDEIIQVRMGYSDYEMALDMDRENDVLKAAQADQIRVNSGLNTRNEVRVSNGDEEVDDPMANKLTITTTQGAVPIGQQLADPAQKSTMIERGDPTLMPEPYALKRYVNGHA